MKKTISLVLVIMIIMLFPGMAYAHATHSIVHKHEDVFEKEVTIEVNNEEEFLGYTLNPNYKYTFIIQSPQAPRAVCYMCGRSTMGVVKIKDQGTTYTVGCPWNQLQPDVFITWFNYEAERCTACGYQSSPWRVVDTYTAEHGRDVYEVRVEWTREGGYDLHNVYDYWMRPWAYVV